MIEVTASTRIPASAHAVWSTLTAFERFATWNPFIRHATGTAVVGETLTLRVRPSLRVPLRFRATVLDCDEDHELRWYGQVLSPWLAWGEHTFTIEPIDEHHVRFQQTERFGGLLPRLAARLLTREAKHGFDAMNEALSLEVSARHGTPGCRAPRRS